MAVRGCWPSYRSLTRWICRTVPPSSFMVRERVKSSDSAKVVRRRTSPEKVILLQYHSHSPQRHLRRVSLYTSIAIHGWFKQKIARKRPFVSVRILSGLFFCKFTCPFSQGDRVPSEHSRAFDMPAMMTQVAYCFSQVLGLVIRQL